MEYAEKECFHRGLTLKRAIVCDSIIQKFLTITTFQNLISKNGTRFYLEILFLLKRKLKAHIFVSSLKGLYGHEKELTGKARDRNIQCDIIREAKAHTLGV